LVLKGKAARSVVKNLKPLEVLCMEAALKKINFNHTPAKFAMLRKFPLFFKNLFLENFKHH